ncbi:hypothetical protein CN171_29385 [Sinorhizobium meliloti]|nr:hypothetical protein [Sinorhizobium meliloti]RVJ47848.1 hypothetical protein CN175_26865 [Sinorhizobium meliloti]RVJ67060.1 hypothetical protein CN171_29385 [Sinorhizobium meliloti]RVJ86407.1 hypothetical protein CN169_27705 [Sinorhizobium meliloti]
MRPHRARGAESLRRIDGRHKRQRHQEQRPGGEINRLKTIKRAIYGRAGPELLRARVLPLDQNRHHTK